MRKRFALLIGNTEYSDPLSRLKAPDSDVDALNKVLRARHIGAFDDVIRMVNSSQNVIQRQITMFFSGKERDNLLLLYFSGHGFLDEEGLLYLAAIDTDIKVPKATAVSTSFIASEMDRSSSKQQVLILDCCHSGAFFRGTKGSPSPGTSVNTGDHFKGSSGYGRFVLTATDAIQYAWDGKDWVGKSANSLFTADLIHGLTTGDADLDRNGQITPDELHKYIYQQAIEKQGAQTPSKWIYGQQGEIVIAYNPFQPISEPPSKSTIPGRNDDFETDGAPAASDASLAEWIKQRWQRTPVMIAAFLQLVLSFLPPLVQTITHSPRFVVWFDFALFALQAAIIGSLLGGMALLQHKSSKVIDDFYNYWRWLWITWLFFYTALAVRLFLDGLLFNAQPPFRQPDWVWEPISNSLNNLQTVFILACYFTLAPPVNPSKGDASRNKAAATEMQPFVWVAFTLFAIFNIVFSIWTYFTFPSHSHYYGAMGFRFASGLAGGIGLALLVGRFEKNCFDAPAWARILLYLYAVIQILYAGFQSQYFEGIVTSVALSLKIVIFAFVAWLLTTDRMLFFTKVAADLNEYTIRKWEEFKDKQFRRTNAAAAGSDSGA